MVLLLFIKCKVFSGIYSIDYSDRRVQKIHSTGTVDSPIFPILLNQYSDSQTPAIVDHG
jgi:hypothetical protein